MRQVTRILGERDVGEASADDDDDDKDGKGCEEVRSSERAVATAGNDKAICAGAGAVREVMAQTLGKSLGRSRRKQ